MTQLQYGDLIQLIDSKQRRYSMTLTEGGEFQNHNGNVSHDDIVDQNEGIVVESNRGQAFRVFRPSLSEYIIGMPRGAQVIYPKDIAAILMMADIAPQHTVFETGVGSGALSMGILRMGARIEGLEMREDFASRAKKNVSDFLGEDALERYNVHIGDAYESVPNIKADRAVLDLPEPWRNIPLLRSILSAGSIVVSYSPSIIQVKKVVEAFSEHGFRDIATEEVLHRSWHIKGDAVRPDHRMVAHTGFLTRAKLVG